MHVRKQEYEKAFNFSDVILLTGCEAVVHKCPAGYSCKFYPDESTMDKDCSCDGGGTFRDFVIRLFVCVCPAGNSSQDLNACLSNPCLNGATCTYSNGTYSCLCPPEYTGTKCQYIKDPIPNPCLNGGTFSLPKEPVCQCPPGYNGKTCQESFVDKPLAMELSTNDRNVLIAMCCTLYEIN